MKTRASIYARVSSERQAGEDRVSIDMQLSDCEAYCKDKGYVIVERYVDKEKYRSRGKLVQSSGQRKDRPAYQSMLRAAAAYEIDVIVAWKEDRLYRGMYPAMPLSELLDEKGKSLRVELVRETFDHKMLGIKAAMGKIEVDNIRERMLMGRRARLERGEVPRGNQVRYGYSKVKKRLEIDEEEAAIVRQMFDWYVSGETNMTFRKRLNASGKMPRRSKLWSKATICSILAGEFYATGNSPTTLEDEVFHIPCPPIISMDTWRKSQQVRDKNRVKPRNVKRDYLCLGITYCTCGWKCNVRTVRSNRYRGYTSVSGAYVCQRYSTKPESRPADCVTDTGSKKVDDFVWDFVKRVCSNPMLVQQAITAKLANLREDYSRLESEVQHLQREMDGLITERQWVITQARKGRITEEDMELQLGQIELQEWSHRRDLDERQSMIAARKQVESLSEWTRQYLDDINAGVRALDIDTSLLYDKEIEPLYTEMEAWRYAEKFPDDRLAQLNWALLEERRRIVRTLIEKVVIGRGEDGTGRKITPILALELPVDDLDFFVYGDQSLEYIETKVGNWKWAIGSMICE
ncbi:MAG TPA: recombinase family protein [Patescibacteria group bacterium]|nr:recombinase family protein [Patescibacteria group bacterium]